MPKDVRRPANIEANNGLIQEIKSLMPAESDKSRLVRLGRAVDKLLGDASGSGESPSELGKSVSWWEDRDEKVKGEIRQDLMAYLKAYYESDLVAPETEGEEPRLTEGLQVALAE